MNEPISFVVRDIITERAIDGNTIIKTESVPKFIKVEITIPNCNITNKEYIRSRLLNEYDRIINIDKVEDDKITIGTLL